MKLNHVSLFLAGFTLAVLFGSRAVYSADDPKPGDTLQNLQAAYNGESNARARYLAFAEGAQKEGYAKVAALFRAAARAEQVHAANHAKVIEALGAKPKADIQPVQFTSTKEALKAAIAGESYERDTMYPQFLKIARAEGKRDAIKSFNFALSAEGQHAKLYQAALDNLDAWKGADQVFYVCPVCGATEAVRPGAKCPVCFTAPEKFEKIS